MHRVPTKAQTLAVARHSNLFLATPEVLHYWLATTLVPIHVIAARLYVSEQTLKAWFRKGKFPPPVRLSSQTLRWRALDVELWINRRAYETATAYLGNVVDAPSIDPFGIGIQPEAEADAEAEAPGIDPPPSSLPRRTTNVST